MYHLIDPTDDGGIYKPPNTTKIFNNTLTQRILVQVFNNTSNSAVPLKSHIQNDIAESQMSPAVTWDAKVSVQSQTAHPPNRFIHVETVQSIYSDSGQ